MELIEGIVILITAIVFLSLPRIAKKDYLGLGLIIFLSVLIKGISAFGVHIFHRNMNPVASLWDIFNLPLGILFYRRRIEGFSKFSASTITIGYLILALFNYFFFQGIHNVNSYTSTASSIGFMSLSIAYFAALFFQLSENQSAKGMFWINSAVLLYFSGMFFMNLVVDYLFKYMHSDLGIVWFVCISFSIVFYGLISFGLIKVRREYLM